MGYQEKKNILLAIMQVIISVGYFYYVAGQYANLIPEADLFVFWAKMIVIMIPVFMTTQLLAIFVFTAIHKKQTGEGFPKIFDERDKIIELKSLRIEYFIFIFGFFASMASILM